MSIEYKQCQARGCRRITRWWIGWDNELEESIYLCYDHAPKIKRSSHEH